MEAIREITSWGYNHTYLVQGNRVLAYVPQGTNTPHYFQHPLRFDRRGRRFEPVTPDLFGTARASSHVVEVQGSKGQTYYVNRQDRICTCPGFRFRGHCRHVEAA